MSETKEYEPFGEEWVKEVSKLPKSFLVDQWRQSRLEVQQLKSTLKECPHCQISPVMCKCCGETL